MVGVAPMAATNPAAQALRDEMMKKMGKKDHS
jgi:hypothetical protein